MQEIIINWKFGVDHYDSDQLVEFMNHIFKCSEYGCSGKIIPDIKNNNFNKQLISDLQSKGMSDYVLDTNNLSWKEVGRC